MSMMTPFAEEIPGFLKIALILHGKAANGADASLVWLDDDGTECLVALASGLDTGSETLTPRMKSWFSGMAEVGAYLKARHKTDEEGVTEDDIERAALTLAFPKLAQDKAVLEILKRHLDLLQEAGIVEALTFHPKTDPETADDPKVDETPDTPTPDTAAIAQTRAQTTAAPAPKTDTETAVTSLGDRVSDLIDTAETATDLAQKPADTDATDTPEQAGDDTDTPPQDDEKTAAPQPARPFISRPDTGLNPRLSPYNAGYASPARPVQDPGSADQD